MASIVSKRGPVALAVAAVAALLSIGLLVGLIWWQLQEQSNPRATGGEKAAAGASAAKARAASDPDAASRIVEALIADVRAANRDFARQAADQGYLSAIGAASLQNPSSLAGAPERIRGVRELVETTRAKQIARTDVAITAIKALPIQSDDQKIVVEDMLAELEKNRGYRNNYWNAMLASADGLEGMARVLIRTQGTWTPDMASRSITFVNDTDAAAYDAETFRRQGHEGEADRRLSQLNRSADALTTLAKDWGE